MLFYIKVPYLTRFSFIIFSQMYPPFEKQEGILRDSKSM